MRETRPKWREFRPGGYEQHYRELLRALDTGCHQFQRSRINPLQVFENNEYWLACRQSFELSQQCRQRLLLAFLWTELLEPVRVAHGQRQEVGENGGVLGIRCGSRNKIIELGQLFSGRVPALKPGCTFELTNEREQSTVGMVCRAEIAQRDVRFTFEPLIK